MLLNHIGRPEQRKHNPAKEVDGNGSGEDHRPALCQLKDVSSQIDTQESRHSPHGVHEAKDTTRVSWGQVLWIDRDAVIVKTWASYDDCHAGESCSKIRGLTHDSKGKILTRKATALNDLPDGRERPISSHEPVCQHFSQNSAGR